MGTWGSGVFENDAALDMVGSVLEIATAANTSDTPLSDGSNT